MTQKQRTHSYKRIKLRTPGGNLKIRYEKRKPSIAHCSECKKELKGVPRGLPYEIRKLPKSSRRPERPFGGQLCSECTRKRIKQRFNISKQSVLEPGQICVKLAGREAGKICVIIEKLDDTFVIIDGQTKRKRCNIMHLSPLEQKIKLPQKPSHEQVVKELKALNIEVAETKPKQKTQKLLKHRKSLEKPEPVKKEPVKEKNAKKQTK